MSDPGVSPLQGATSDPGVSLRCRAPRPILVLCLSAAGHHVQSWCCLSPLQGTTSNPGMSWCSCCETDQLRDIPGSARVHRSIPVLCSLISSRQFSVESCPSKCARIYQYHTHTHTHRAGTLTQTCTHCFVLSTSTGWESCGALLGAALTLVCRGACTRVSDQHAQHTSIHNTTEKHHYGTRAGMLRSYVSLHCADMLGITSTTPQACCGHHTDTAQASAHRNFSCHLRNSNVFINGDLDVDRQQHAPCTRGHLKTFSVHGCTCAHQTTVLKLRIPVNRAKTLIMLQFFLVVQ